MSDALKRIGNEVKAFSDAVAKCAHNPEVPGFREAYSAMNRAWNRYGVEADAHSLNQAEHAALRKRFEEDRFLKSMGYMRTISEHVLKRGGCTLYRPDGSHFDITEVSSAAVAFSAPRVTLIDAKGNPQFWPHDDYLVEAERGIVGAYEKAERD